MSTGDITGHVMVIFPVRARTVNDINKSAINSRTIMGDLMAVLRTATRSQHIVGLLKVWHSNFSDPEHYPSPMFAFASSIENLWKEGRNALKETSHAVLGLRRRKKHQWISDETLGTIDEHRTARLCGNKVLVRRLATKRKQQLRRNETAWYRRIADEAEYANRTGNSAVLYRTIRTLTGRTAFKLPPVTAKDGSPLCDETDQLH